LVPSFHGCDNGVALGAPDDSSFFDVIEPGNEAVDAGLKTNNAALQTVKREVGEELV